MGRRTKFTPETVKLLLQTIAAGTPQSVTCDAVGITEETLSQWRKSKPAFSAQFKKARAAFVTSNLRAIRAAGNKSWQARAWLLERCNPEQFCRSRIELNHSGRVGQDLVVTGEALTAIADSRKRYELERGNG